MRAIGVSHMAYKDEFQRNLRSHNCSVFFFFFFCNTTVECCEVPRRGVDHQKLSEYYSVNIYARPSEVTRGHSTSIPSKRPFPPVYCSYVPT